MALLFISIIFALPLQSKVAFKQGTNQSSHYSLNRGHEKLQILQEQWEACSGDWKSSSFYRQIKHRDSLRTHGARCWMTRTQLAKKYESKSIADSICDAKLADPEVKKVQVKPHPDCPSEEAPLQHSIV